MITKEEYYYKKAKIRADRDDLLSLVDLPLTSKGEFAQLWSHYKKELEIKEEHFFNKSADWEKEIIKLLLDRIIKQYLASDKLILSEKEVVSLHTWKGVLFDRYTKTPIQNITHRDFEKTEKKINHHILIHIGENRYLNLDNFYKNVHKRCDGELIKEFNEKIRLKDTEQLKIINTYIDYEQYEKAIFYIFECAKIQKRENKEILYKEILSSAFFENRDENLCHFIMDMFTKDSDLLDLLIEGDFLQESELENPYDNEIRQPLIAYRDKITLNQTIAVKNAKDKAKRI